ncbi:MAG: hypothetical protein V8R90_12695 [Eubacterium sp.]
MNPVIAYNYFQFPTYSFMLNIMVVPLLGVSGDVCVCVGETGNSRRYVGIS